MVGTFSFPPPPPPPPKASSETSVSHQYADRGRGNGRGRGSGRGGFDGRGRGGSRGRGNHQNRQHGAYNPHSSFGHGGNQSSPGDQAMSADQPFSAPRTFAGHKRKLEALRPPSHGMEKKPARETAPAVPSFGLPIIQPQTSSSQPTPMKARSLNTRSLGLIPTAAEDEPSSDSDEEIDEEAMYAELGTKLTFEHDGQVLSLTTPADLEDWKKERRRNFPTRARMSEREMERMKVGRERRRLLDEAAKLDLSVGHSAPSREGQQRHSTSTKQSSAGGKNGAQIDDAGRLRVPGPDHGGSERSFVSNDNAMGAQTQTAALPSHDAASSQALPPQTKAELVRQIEERTASLEKLRRRVEESQAQARASQPSSSAQASENDTTIAANAQEATTEAHEDSAAVTAKPVIADLAIDEVPEPEALPRLTSVSPSSSSDSDSDADSSSDSDAPPEEISSNPNPPADSSQPGRVRPVCRYFVASGYCRDGEACRFRHELPTRASGAERPPPSQRHDPQGMQPRERRDPPGTQVPDVDGSASARKGLFDRLVAQEMEDENKLALEVVKYLGGKGFFAAAELEAGEMEVDGSGQ